MSSCLYCLKSSSSTDVRLRQLTFLHLYVYTPSSVLHLSRRDSASGLRLHRADASDGRGFVRPADELSKDAGQPEHGADDGVGLPAVSLLSEQHEQRTSSAAESQRSTGNATLTQTNV